MRPTGVSECPPRSGNARLPGSGFRQRRGRASRIPGPGPAAGVAGLRVAITGATGFTGRRVLRRLLERGHEVRALVRPPTARLGVPQVSVVPGELGEPQALADLLAGCDAVVCVAPIVSHHVASMIEAVEAGGVGRAVFFSSTSLHSRLATAARDGWLRAEDRVRRAATGWTLLRPTMIYGDEGDRNLSRLIRFVARTPLIPLPGGGRALVQPVHVEDVATAAADALESERSVRQAYDLPGGAADPLRDLVAFVRTEVGSRAPIVALPIRPLAAASAVWTSLGLPPRIRREQVLRLDEDRAFSADPARRDFGFAPRGWREGLRDETRRLREIGWIR